MKKQIIGVIVIVVSLLVTLVLWLWELITGQTALIMIATINLLAMILFWLYDWWDRRRDEIQRRVRVLKLRLFIIFVIAIFLLLAALR